VLFTIFAGKFQQHVNKVSTSALGLVTINVVSLGSGFSSVFLDYGLQSLIQLLVQLQGRYTKLGSVIQLGFAVSGISQSKMVQDLLDLPLVSLQVEGCKPGDEVADVQDAEEMEAGHEEMHHVVVVGLTSWFRNRQLVQI
jgi:hypothetical protein